MTRVLALSVALAATWAGAHPGLEAAGPLLAPPGGPFLTQTPIDAYPPLPAPQLGAPGALPDGTAPSPMPIQPVPQPYLPGQPLLDAAPWPGAAVPYGAGPPLAAPPLAHAAPAVPLYPNVREISPHKKHPCGVTQVIQVPDPTPRYGCCDPVFVAICVPPGCAPEVTVGPRGQRVTYAYGGYRVQVTSLRGVVTVDYDRR